MKEILLQLLKYRSNSVDKLNLCREYLQASVLRSLHGAGAFRNLSFVGGTALRFLYNLPRFSEGLDFSLEDTTHYEPRAWLTKLKRDLEFEGFVTTILWNDKKTAHTAWVRVESVLYEAGLSPLPGQKLAIKVEIDSSPPSGAVITSSLVNRYQLLTLRHHDLSSLMAGTIRALLTRPFTKGRDWYDLVWYRSLVPPVQPNLELLAAGLAQPPVVDLGGPAESWPQVLRTKLSNLDWDLVVADVGPFLERPGDLDLLDRELVGRVL